MDIICLDYLRRALNEGLADDSDSEEEVSSSSGRGSGEPEAASSLESVQMDE